MMKLVRWGLLSVLCVLLAGVLLGKQRRRGFDFSRLAWRAQRDVWRAGLPTGLQFVLDIAALGAAMLPRLQERQLTPILEPGRFLVDGRAQHDRSPHRERPRRRFAGGPAAFSCEPRPTRGGTLGT